MRRRQLLGAAAAGVAVAALPAGAFEARRLFPAPGIMRYRVLREGDDIGHHRLEFLRRDGAFVVRTDVDIKVTILGLTAFRYRLRAEETWAGGRLQGLVSRTDDDGEEWRLAGERRDGMLQLSVNGKRRSAPGDVLPSSLWHRDTPNERALLDIVKGKLRAIEGIRRGEERVPVDDERVRASRYSITGELRREVWYDAERRLVRVELPAKDGSWVAVEPV